MVDDQQDLSLLTQLSLSDVESLQSVGKDHQESKKKYILRDDSDEAWQAITSLKADRVDFVLDNGELTADVCSSKSLENMTFSWVRGESQVSAGEWQTAH